MAAGSGGKVYGEWSKVNLEINGFKVTVETDLSEEKFLRKLDRAGLAPRKTTCKYVVPKPGKA